MRPFRRTIETLELDGGILCLNFVNTVKSRFESPLHEYIVNYNDLILWSVRTNICNSESAEKLKFYIQRNEENAPKDLNRIMKTREVLYRIFLCISKKKSPSNNDIRYFNKQLSIVFSRISLEINENLDINVVWSPNSFNFQMILNPIIKSAYDLLTSDIKTRIKECPNCGWLFLDKSKNNTRQWCNMNTCGNTIKIKKYYERTRMKRMDKHNRDF